MRNINNATFFSIFAFLLYENKLNEWKKAISSIREKLEVLSPRAAHKFSSKFLINANGRGVRKELLVIVCLYAFHVVRVCEKPKVRMGRTKLLFIQAAYSMSSSNAPIHPTRTPGGNRKTNGCILMLLLCGCWRVVFFLLLFLFRFSFASCLLRVTREAIVSTIVAAL